MRAVSNPECRENGYRRDHGRTADKPRRLHPIRAGRRRVTSLAEPGRSNDGQWTVPERSVMTLARSTPTILTHPPHPRCYRCPIFGQFREPMDGDTCGTVPYQMAGRTYRQQSTSERRAARRTRLIEAAVEAFGTNGYLSTSIEQLCGAAGISARNFYEEFPNREALLATLHDLLNEKAFDAVVVALADLDPTDVGARATEGVRAYFKVMTSDPRWARIALVESVGVSVEVEQHRQAALDRFAVLLEAEANRLAELRLIPARDYRLTAIGLVGAINGLINTWTTRDDWDAVLDDVIDEAARLIIAAIGFR